jgi:hypothetical protein
MEGEDLYSAPIGTFASIKMMFIAKIGGISISSRSTRNHLHSIAFPPRIKVVLLKTRAARPELNGKGSIVVCGFDSKLE